MKDLWLFIRLYYLMRLTRPDVFIGYTVKPIVWGILAATAAGVPKRVALVTGLGYAFTNAARGRRAVIHTVVRKLYTVALQHSNLILFQNEDDRDEFLRLGIISGKIATEIVNGSGVDTEHFIEAPLPRGPVTFLLIARLLGDKGIREYVEAARLLRKDWPDVQFRLVGGLDTNPDSLGLKEVLAWQEAGLLTWVGEVQDVRPEIVAAHVYVLPSYREGTPRSVLEAMSIGRAIITTNAPGCRQTVEQGVNGLLVPVADPYALKTAMQTFLQNPDLIARMGRHSRRIAVKKYDVRKVNEAVLSAIRSL